MNQDGQDIQKTLAGNTDAFAALVQRHQGRLFSTLTHVIGNQDEAEDVTQEAFVRAFSQLHRFEGRAGFYTWIYRIAYNVWVSRLRKQKQKPSVSVDEAQAAAGVELTDRIDTPLAQLERNERVGLIRQALDQLPDEVRAILVMREMDGLSYEALAEILEVPVGTIRSRLHRARLQLKRQLELTLHEPT